MSEFADGGGAGARFLSQDEMDQSWAIVLRQTNADLSRWTAPDQAREQSRNAYLRQIFATNIEANPAHPNQPAGHMTLRLLTPLVSGRDTVTVDLYVEPTSSLIGLSHAELWSKLRTEGLIPSCECRLSLDQLFLSDSGLKIGRVFRAPPCDHFIHVETNMDVAVPAVPAVSPLQVTGRFDDDIFNPYLLRTPLTEGVTNFWTEFNCRAHMSAETNVADSMRTRTGLIDHVNHIRNLQHTACVA